MPFRSNYFDCVVDCECIYSNSFSDSKIILKEIKRILKKKDPFFQRLLLTELMAITTVLNCMEREIHTLK